MADEAFRANKLKVQEKISKSEAFKVQKLAVAKVNAAAVSGSAVATMSPGGGAVVAREPGQINLQFHPASAADIDGAIARFFYACNISAATVEHPQFKNMVYKLRTAPVDYKTPHRKKMHGPLLETTVSELQTETAPLREAVLRDCGSFMCAHPKFKPYSRNADQRISPMPPPTPKLWPPRLQNCGRGGSPLFRVE